jgi:ribosomal protein S12 methylthiotransferase accessory factor
MEMIIDFPGGARVDAHYGSFTIQTDQPPAASAPTPFTLLLASMGTCAGIYVLGFCQQRGLPTEGIRIVQRMEKDPLTGLIANIELEIRCHQRFPRNTMPLWCVPPRCARLKSTSSILRSLTCIRRLPKNRDTTGNKKIGMLF